VLKVCAAFITMCPRSLQKLMTVPETMDLSEKRLHAVSGICLVGFSCISLVTFSLVVL